LITAQHETGVNPWLDIEPGGALEQLAGAAARYRIAVGPMAGRKAMTLQSPDAVSGEQLSVKPLTATRDGFSISACLNDVEFQRNQ